MYSQIFSITFKSGDYAGHSIKVTLFWSYTFLQCGLCEQVHCHPWKSSFYLQQTRQLLTISSCLECQYVLGELMLPLTVVRVQASSTQIYPQIIKLVVWVVLFVLFSPKVNVDHVCTEHNLTFVGKYYFFPVVVYCSTSLQLTCFIRFASRTTIFFFANLSYSSECNTLWTVLVLKVFVLHSFSFAVMFCNVFTDSEQTALISFFRNGLLILGLKRFK